MAAINKGIALGATNLQVAYYSRGEIEDDSGHYAQAYRDYKQALMIKPDYAPAQRQLERFKVVPPEHANAVIMRGAVCRLRCSPAACRRPRTRWWRWWAPVLAHDCFVMAKAGVDPRGARRHLQPWRWRKRRSMPAPRAGTYVNRGVMKVALGHIDDAMSDYDRALAINPGTWAMVMSTAARR